MHMAVTAMLGASAQATTHHPHAQEKDFHAAIPFRKIRKFMNLQKFRISGSRLYLKSDEAD
jgi:hypothetical protein